jgi:tungstate transport system permease protein
MFSRIMISISNALVGFPTVVVGLILYIILSRSGPLGNLGLLYTPYAMIIGQAVLITPLMVSMGVEVIETESKELIEMAMTFGASTPRMMKMIIFEMLPKMIAVSIIGFQRAIGELGVALMLGGNIKGFTRVFTTVIALEIQKGEFELAISLGIILIVIDFIIVLILRLIGWRR